MRSPSPGSSQYAKRFFANGSTEATLNICPARGWTATAIDQGVGLLPKAYMSQARRASCLEDQAFPRSEKLVSLRFSCFDQIRGEDQLHHRYVSTFVNTSGQRGSKTFVGFDGLQIGKKMRLRWLSRRRHFEQRRTHPDDHSAPLRSAVSLALVLSVLRAEVCI